MNQPSEAHSWFGPSLLEPGLEPSDKPQEFERLWRGFMTMRVTLGLVLLLLQSTLYALGTSDDNTLILLCTGYFAAALTVRLKARPRQLGHSVDFLWLATIGIDILAFASLQTAQGSSIN